MTLKARLLGLTLGLAVGAPGGLSGSVRAQNPESVTFATAVDLVSLDVRVTGPDGRAVSDLGQGDFLVLEDGVPQPLTLVTAGVGTPFVALLLIDRSHSMYGDKLRLAKAAARSFVELMGPDDRVGVLAFNAQVRRAASLGDEQATVLTGIDAIPAGSGATGLYEAVLVGLNDLEWSRAVDHGMSRDVLLVLSDGEDTMGRIAFDEVVKEVRRHHVLVYAVAMPSDDGRRATGPGYALTQLALETGGRAVVAPDAEALPDLYRESHAELRQLYRLAYVSRNEREDGAWRKISVRVPSRDVHVRTRSGYYARRATP